MVYFFQDDCFLLALLYISLDEILKAICLTILPALVCLFAECHSLLWCPLFYTALLHVKYMECPMKIMFDHRDTNTKIGKNGLFLL